MLFLKSRFAARSESQRFVFQTAMVVRYGAFLFGGISTKCFALVDTYISRSATRAERVIHFSHGRKMAWLGQGVELPSNCRLPEHQCRSSSAVPGRWLSRHFTATRQADPC